MRELLHVYCRPPHANHHSEKTNIKSILLVNFAVKNEIKRNYKCKWYPFFAIRSKVLELLVYSFWKEPLFTYWEMYVVGYWFSTKCNWWHSSMGEEEPIPMCGPICCSLHGSCIRLWLHSSNHLFLSPAFIHELFAC